MSFNVRFFGYRGTRQIQQMVPNQFTSTISEVLVQPYDWSQVVATAGAAPVSTAVISPDLATLVYIEIPDGQSIRYEFNSPGRVVVQAGTVSPKLSGVQIFPWAQGTIISLVEGASYP